MQPPTIAQARPSAPEATGAPTQPKPPITREPTVAPVDPFPQPGTPFAETRPASPERRGTGGLGLVRLRVEVDGPAERTTSRHVEAVSGVVVAGAAVRVVVKSGDGEQPLTLKDGRFQGNVQLERGANKVHVVATDAQGGEAEVRLTMNYVPPPVPDGIAILAPPTDSALSADDPPVVLVRGRVEDPAITTVWVTANRARFPVPVRDGSFEQLVPIVEPRVHVVASVTGGSGGAERRSAPVTVRSTDVPTGVFFIDWGVAGPRSPSPMRLSWRGRPDRLDGPGGSIALKTVPGPSASTSDVYYVRGLRAGVYTLILETIQGSRPPVSATLYLPLPGDPGLRHLTRLRVNPLGRVLVGKLLYPLGILWDQDEWSSGRSESAETITKFNMDGVSWIERKADVR